MAGGSPVEHSRPLRFLAIVLGEPELRGRLGCDLGDQADQRAAAGKVLLLRTIGEQAVAAHVTASPLWALVGCPRPSVAEHLLSQLRQPDERTQ